MKAKVEEQVKDPVVEIEEATVEEKVEVKEQDTEGLSPEEIEQGKKLGIINMITQNLFSI